MSSASFVACKAISVNYAFRSVIPISFINFKVYLGLYISLNNSLSSVTAYDNILTRFHYFSPIDGSNKGLTVSIRS